MHLRALTIARRAGLGFSLIALMVAALGAFALVQMSAIRQSEVTVETNWVPSMRIVTDIRETMLRIRSISLRLALDPDPKNAPTYKSQMDNRTQVLSTQLKTLEGFIDTPEERTLYEPFKASLIEYQTALAKSFVLADQGQRDALNVLLLVDMKRVIEGSGNQLQALSDHYNERVEHEGKAAGVQYSRSFTIVLVFVLLAALATVVLALWLTRSIVQPLGDAVKAAEAVAAGDLTQPLPSNGNDEITRLFRALLSMQQSLRDTLQLIHGSAQQLGSAASELDAVTQDSTSSVNRQNDEIEQAATAINQMTSAVEEVARNAVSTSEASSHSSTSAQQGKTRVEETVSAIQALSGDVQSTSRLVQHLAAQSQDVGKVLDVIRSIAEQTNLLALNAAIEAARAGESGRGFAVVADEVRALAHRTQQSTLEIDQMINGMRGGSTQALESMNRSNTLAAQTLEKALAAGEALSEITASVGQISERNLVIASAAEQQAQVAREVDRNIVNIRDLSIQSADGVHKISVSSGELARLASELNQAVARFRL